MVQSRAERRQPAAVPGIGQAELLHGQFHHAGAGQFLQTRLPAMIGFQVEHGIDRAMPISQS